MKTRTTITINKEVEEQLKKIAIEENRNKSNLINLAIEYFLENFEKKKGKKIRLG
jgi:predicted transcriptional regulator